ncbi:MAG: VTT domain-containing protein [Dehalococcoidia bacterium]|nr:VTT domain-containing protein [Dehalococcoidia bacterium]
MVISVVSLCYAIIRLWPYLEGFEQYGYLGAFLVAFITSITIMFPLPGFAIIGVIAINPDLNWALVALAAAIGGGLGEFTAYLAGYGGAAIITPRQSKWYKMAEGWMERYGTASIFLFALTPLPFDIVGIAAGALRFPFWKFILATIAGRLPKTFIGVYLTYLGWVLLQPYWHLWSELAWWFWMIVGVCIAVIIGGSILIWRRWQAGR